MKKYIISALIILFFTGQAIGQTWESIMPGANYDMYIDNGNGTFKRTQDPRWVNQVSASVEKNYPLSDFHSSSINCASGYARLKFTSVPDVNSSTGPIGKIYERDGPGTNTWRYLKTYNSGPPPYWKSYIIQWFGCVTANPLTNDADGDGVVDANDSEPLNPNIWTEQSCVDPAPGCHVGIYSQQPVDGSVVDILERFYDENGNLVWAKVAFYQEGKYSCNEEGKNCVGVYETHEIGDRSFVDEWSTGSGSGTLKTDTLQTTTTEEFTTEMSKNLNGSTNSEPLQKVVVPQNFIPYGQVSSDPGATATTEIYDYRGQNSAIITNQGEIAGRQEKQISQLERIARAVEGTERAIGKGIGNNPASTGTGTDGVPWGSDGGSPYADPESEESEETTENENMTVPQQIEAVPIGPGDIPLEYQEYSDGVPWQRIYDFAAENNPIGHALNNIELNITAGSCSTPITTSFGTFSLSMCEYESVLEMFGSIMLSICTFTSCLMLVRRG